MGSQLHHTPAAEAGRGLAWTPRAVVWLCCFSAACADDTLRVTAGQDFPIQRAVALRRGVSTEKDVLDLFGAPLEKQIRSKQKQQWRYFVRKEQKIFVFGIFQSSTRVTEKELLIFLDRSLLEDFKKETRNFEQ